MSFRPCTIILRDGTAISCDRITETGVTIVGETLGSVTIARAGRSERLIADYIQEIREEAR